MKDGKHITFRTWFQLKDSSRWYSVLVGVGIKESGCLSWGIRAYHPGTRADERLLASVGLWKLYGGLAGGGRTPSFEPNKAQRVIVGSEYPTSHSVIASVCGAKEVVGGAGQASILRFFRGVDNGEGGGAAAAVAGGGAVGGDGRGGAASGSAEMHIDVDVSPKAGVQGAKRKRAPRSTLKHAAAEQEKKDSEGSDGERGRSSSSRAAGGRAKKMPSEQDDDDDGVGDADADDEEFEGGKSAGAPVGGWVTRSMSGKGSPGSSVPALPAEVGSDEDYEFDWSPGGKDEICFGDDEIEDDDDDDDAGMESVKVATSYIGKRITKEFGEGTEYEGTVTSFTAPYWSISYDDGDDEDFEAGELRQGMELFAERHKKPL